MEANEIQKRMGELQKSGNFANSLGKLLSKKPGYTAVVEKKRVNIRCLRCGKVFENSIKACPGCGSKVEMPRRV
jgi:rRNA maturation endonuclease Nob1